MSMSQNVFNINLAVELFVRFSEPAVRHLFSIYVLPVLVNATFLFSLHVGLSTSTPGVMHIS